MKQQNSQSESIYHTRNANTHSGKITTQEVLLQVERKPKKKGLWYESSIQIYYKPKNGLSNPMGPMSLSIPFQVIALAN